MIALFILNFIFPNANASVVDTCTGTYCNASIKINGVEKFSAKVKEKTELMEWINSKKDVESSWGRPEETKDFCPTGYAPTDIDGNVIPVDDRTETSKTVVNLEYPIFDEDGTQTGTGNHDCDRYVFPSDYIVEVTNADAEKAESDAYATAKKVRGICDHILNLIVAYNISNSFTTAQIDQMKIDFAAAKSYLQDYQPWAAKAEVAGITPNETIVTTAFKTKLLDAFSNSGLPGL